MSRNILIIGGAGFIGSHVVEHFSEKYPDYNLIVVNKLTYAANKLIKYVEDRKGHDHRYAIDHSKITETVGWKPMTSFRDGLIKTIEYYESNLVDEKE